MFRRHAASLVRSLLVGASTLTILGVGIVIYQVLQPPVPESEERPIRRRIPVPEIDESAPTGLELDQRVQLREGRAIKFSMYGQEGDRAIAEVSLHSWTPIAGSPNSFDVVRPEVRLLTRTGHGIMAVAQKGVLETRGKIGSNTDVRRGRLFGDVVIEIDRLSESDRQKLPEEIRNKIDPSKIVRIETEEIQFDYEFSKILIPHRVRLVAEDARVDAGKVEMRFNEKEGRIEYCRIGTGGTIELLKEYAGLELSAGLGNQADSETPLSDWLGNIVTSALAARHELQQPELASPKEDTEGDTPVFREKEADDADEREDLAEAVRYHARFEGGIKLVQQAGEEVELSLDADLLTVLRDFTQKERKRIQRANGSDKAANDQPAEAAEAARETLKLTWTDRLAINAIMPGKNEKEFGDTPNITATGSPVVIKSADGFANCERVSFIPEKSDVSLYGSTSLAAEVQLPGQGLLRGNRIRFGQDGTKFSVHANGPGRLSQGDEIISPDDAPGIIFADRFTAHGTTRFENVISLSGRIARRSYRVLDRAVIDGKSTLINQGNTLDSDRLEVAFGSQKTANGIEQTFDHLTGTGNVVMKQESDSLHCDRIDVKLATLGGRPFPKIAVATGNVSATQGQRKIECTRELTAHFDVIERASGAFDPVSEYHRARLRGDSGEIDWEAAREAHRRKTRRTAVITHIESVEDVRVSDPRQQLQLTAHRLECDVADGSQISRATIYGRPGEASTVQLEQITVVGEKIELDAIEKNTDVAGAGKMTILSRRDLDGRTLANPVPIDIAWGQSMKYRDRAGKAEFIGGVHAQSQSKSSFDCRHLMIEFDDAPAKNLRVKRNRDWWVLNDLLGTRGSERSSNAIQSGTFEKQPAFLLASGGARAVTWEPDTLTGGLSTRAMIEGDRLSLNLRDDVSRLMIDGEGSLLLEDFRAAVPGTQGNDAALFELGRRSGPSKTPIYWKEKMWFDFGRRIARFEGDVELKHFSGRKLFEMFGSGSNHSPDEPGRSTFLNCRELTVEFKDREARDSQSADSRRLGGMSTASIKTFTATNRVRLIDETEGLFIEGGQIGFDRTTNMLTVQGNEQHSASFVRQTPGQLPQRALARRFVFNIESRELSVSQPVYEGRN